MRKAAYCGKGRQPERVQLWVLKGGKQKEIWVPPPGAKAKPFPHKGPHPMKTRKPQPSPTFFPLYSLGLFAPKGGGFKMGRGQKKRSGPIRDSSNHIAQQKNERDIEEYMNGTLTQGITLRRGKRESVRVVIGFGGGRGQKAKPYRGPRPKTHHNASAEEDRHT